MKRLRKWWQSLFGGGAHPGGATPRLFVVSAPSGAGKTSLVKALIKRNPGLRISVSYTTRSQRENELDGSDYFFVDADKFKALEAAGEMLESASVFGNFYGTGRAQVARLLAAGHSVILEIDWQGARQVRAKAPDCQSIFILPPSRQELERRLRTRKTDADDVIARRLSESVEDMSHWREFDFVVVNDDFDEALEALARIVAGTGERYRTDNPATAEKAASLVA